MFRKAGMLIYLTKCLEGFLCVKWCKRLGGWKHHHHRIPAVQLLISVCKIHTDVFHGEWWQSQWRKQGKGQESNRGGCGLWGGPPWSEVRKKWGGVLGALRQAWQQREQPEWGPGGHCACWAAVRYVLKIIHVNNGKPKNPLSKDVPRRRWDLLFLSTRRHRPHLASRTYSRVRCTRQGELLSGPPAYCWAVGTGDSTPPATLLCLV